jgi:hypothetical protein
MKKIMSNALAVAFFTAASLSAANVVGATVANSVRRPPTASAMQDDHKGHHERGNAPSKANAQKAVKRTTKKKRPMSLRKKNAVTKKKPMNIRKKAVRTSPMMGDMDMR